MLFLEVIVVAFADYDLEHQNSVDCIAANPANPNEFATGSHDKSIKIWDVNTFKSTKTLLGHQQGVWCVNYRSDGA